MNTYLIPVYCDTDLYINKVYARSVGEAKDKLIEDFIEEFDLDLKVPEWEDLLTALDEIGVLIGDIYDKDEF